MPRFTADNHFKEKYNAIRLPVMENIVQKAESGVPKVCSEAKVIIITVPAHSNVRWPV